MVFILSRENWLKLRRKSGWVSLKLVMLGTNVRGTPVMRNWPLFLTVFLQSTCSQGRTTHLWIPDRRWEEEEVGGTLVKAGSSESVACGNSNIPVLCRRQVAPSSHRPPVACTEIPLSIQSLIAIVSEVWAPSEDGNVLSLKSWTWTEALHLDFVIITCLIPW